MLNKIIKLFVTTKEVPAPTEQEKIQALLQALNEKGDKPSIRRTTAKWQGYERQAFLYISNKDISPYEFVEQVMERITKDTPSADIKLLAIETRRL